MKNIDGKSKRDVVHDKLSFVSYLDFNTCKWFFFRSSSTTTTTLSSTSTEEISESPDIPVTPIFQLLNVQDPPDGKETVVHNDILVKLKEQLRGFFSETAAVGRWF